MQLGSEEWNKFVAESDGGSFLQSWQWGEFQQQFGVDIWRLYVVDGEKITGVALVLKRQLPSGHKWLYVPRGPVFPNSKYQIPNTKLIDQIRALAIEQRALFVRAEPRVWLGEGWRKADHDVQPRHTIIVDLDKSEEALLAAMHAKTRYNIRLAQKRGVQVRFTKQEKDVASFLNLTREVVGRGSFRFHPDEYYRKMLAVLGSVGQCELALAEYGGKILAAHMQIYFGETATYVHGASSSSERQLMAPHLLQWESMQRAKALGYRYYDFFGVSPSSHRASKGTDASHPWAGITRFKEGFGGRRVSFPGAYDFVLNKVGYFMYTAVRKLR